MTGGSDRAKLNKSWPLLLDKMLPRNFNIHWIVGPYSQKPNLELCKNLNFNIYKYPQDIFKIYQKVNYAITIYGVSFFELIAQGIPTVVFSIYGNKDNNEIDFIDDNKLAIKSIDEVNAIEKFIELLNNKKKSQQISFNSQRVLKKPGTTKLGEEVINLLKSF